MASFNNVPQCELVDKTAEKLKNIPEISAPEWAGIVKTGTHKQRPPAKSDWWYVRVAAILRTLALKGPIGVSKLRTKYGGKKRRGHKPAEFRKGSGSIIRKALQQLDKAGLSEKKEKDIHRGRIITTKGIRVLNDAAKDLFSKYPKGSVIKEEPKPAKVEEKPAEPVEEKPVEKKTEAPKVEKKPEAPKEVKEAPKVEEKTEEPKAAEVKEATKEKPVEQKTEEPKPEVKKEPVVETPKPEVKEAPAENQ
jgi:small subunit ribosomal protein S19e